VAIFRNQMMPLQPQGGGIGGLFSRLRRPMTPPMGGFGGFGGGGFGPPPFDPRMRGGFPGMGGGFFGGFRPRFKRRPRPQMPDYSGQISGLEAKIAELQEQLAARQAATPMPDPVMDVAGPSPMIGGMGPGNIQIPNIDMDAIRERIANLNIDVGGEGGRPDMPVSIPVVPKGRPVVSLPPQDVGGRKKLTKGPGMPKKIPMKPPSIERLEEFLMPDIQAQIPEPMPMPAPVMPAPVMPAPVMPAPMPMPSLPKFPMPQIDPMGRVAAPLTRGPVNTAINRPQVAMRGPGMRMR